VNIWTSLGNIHQIKIEIQIAERQFELNRVENDRQTVALKLYIYNNKIKELQEAFKNMRKRGAVISLNEYENMKVDYYFFKDKAADSKMYIDMLDAMILELNKVIADLEIKREKLKTVVIEFKNVRSKNKK